ncbi:MAG TPA: GNAT family N-acetyltransferase [Pseudonocardiaceae bacterium]|nr:GNAT family N-acetyltransferase [Pseudonocardiaceae bacterium]
MTWTVTESPVGDPTAVDLLRRYFDDVASSWYGRPATDAEVAAALAEDPSDHLAVFLVGQLAGKPVGCAGLSFGTPGFAELARVFVAPEARGTGGGPALLAAAERHARDHGAHTIRLDTRLDLTAARRLYTTHGYREIPAFTTGPYAQCWYAKELT